MKKVQKREPYGFVAPRPNFMSEAEQVEQLVDYGVKSHNILNSENGLDEAIRFSGPDADLVVYSVTLFGTVKEYDRVVKAMGKRDACLVVLRTEKEGKPLRIVAKDADAYLMGKKDLNLRNEAIGAEHGRKKTITRATAEKIIHFVTKQGNSQKAAALQYGATTTQVSKIMNGKYFNKKDK